MRLRSPGMDDRGASLTGSRPVVPENSIRRDSRCETHYAHCLYIQAITTRPGLTWAWARTRRWDGPFNNLGPSLRCPFYLDCIIATRGHDFREGQVYRGHVHRGEHEAILDPALFEAVQGRLAAQAVARGGQAHA